MMFCGKNPALRVAEKHYGQHKNNNMMKFVSEFIFATLLLLTSCTTTDCKSKFIGKWKYEQFSAKDMYVVRTLEKQFEYVENGKYYYEFDINWLSECKYELTYVGTNSPNPALAKVGESFAVEIIEISRTTMKYKTIFRELTDIGEMQKIE